MTHPNLILTEKAVKNHSKRVQKEMAKLGQTYSLGESQSLFAKFLGFHHYQELRKVLFEDTSLTKPQGKTLQSISDFYNFIQGLENKTSFIWFLGDGKISYKLHGNNNDGLEYFIHETPFNKEDFQCLLRLLLSEHDFFSIQHLPNSLDHHMVQFRSAFSSKVTRVITTQFYLEKGRITHLKFLLHYVLVDGNGAAKKYQEIRYMDE